MPLEATGRYFVLPTLLTFIPITERRYASSSNHEYAPVGDSRFSPEVIGNIGARIHRQQQCQFTEELTGSNKY